MSISLIRGKVKNFSANSMRYEASGRPGEMFKNRRAMQHFGFVSSVPEGADALILKQGENVWLIASDDSRYRIDVGDGETAIYNESGDCVHLMKNRIEVNAAGVGSRVIVNAQSVELGGETMDPTDGVVTGKCSCVYGVPHPVVSPIVKAKFAP